MNRKIVFKNYNMDQLKFPIDLEINIPENHLVKIVNESIEKMNIDSLFLEKYKDIDSDKLDDFVKRLDEKLSKKPKDKNLKKAVKTIKKD